MRRLRWGPPRLPWWTGGAASHGQSSPSMAQRQVGRWTRCSPLTGHLGTPTRDAATASVRTGRRPPTRGSAGHTARFARTPDSCFVSVSRFLGRADIRTVAAHPAPSSSRFSNHRRTLAPRIDLRSTECDTNTTAHGLRPVPTGHASETAVGCCRFSRAVRGSRRFRSRRRIARLASRGAGAAAGACGVKRARRGCRPQWWDRARHGVRHAGAAPS